MITITLLLVICSYLFWTKHLLCSSHIYILHCDNFQSCLSFFQAWYYKRVVDKSFMVSVMMCFCIIHFSKRSKDWSSLTILKGLWPLWNGIDIYAIVADLKKPVTNCAGTLLQGKPFADHWPLILLPLNTSYQHRNWNLYRLDALLQWQSFPSRFSNKSAFPERHGQRGLTHCGT